MKNIFLALSLFAIVIVTGCNKTEKTTDEQGASSETTTLETTSPTERPAHGESGHNHETDHGQIAAVYTCPMHPEVTQDKPGTCPKCGMDLEKSDAGAKQEAPAQ